MDDAPTEDGVYPVPMIAAAELAVLREMCEADSMPARLEQCSISKLFRLVEGASFLDAPGALNHAQCALATRLNGKRADELRELLGATDDFGSAENREAALAEPAFSPGGNAGGQLSVATAGSVAGPPALQPQPSLSGMAVTDDAKEVALGMVDLGTLAELKGVSQLWLALARRVLCSRLSRCEGQPAPTQMAEITDLNIKILVDAGRPWEAAAAGRMLPSLARLRWEGFEVSVAAVRKVDLETPSQEREFLGGRAKAALLSCIEGNGEPPLELMLAAVACAGSCEVRGIPVQMMRNDSVSELDLRGRNLGVQGGMLLAHLVPIMGALTSLELRGNKLKDEGWGAIFAAICGNKVSKIVFLDASEENIGPAGVKLIAEALSTNVTGGLISINLSWNTLCGLDWEGKGIYTAEGITAIADVLRVNGGLTSLDLSSNQLCGLDRCGRGTYTAEGITAIADALLVNGGLTALNLSSNRLNDEGVSAVCKAIQSNKETKLASLDLKYNGIGPGGANAVAAMVAVTGALTQVPHSAPEKLPFLLL
ncbi:protein nlrc3 [Chrysochromulina tobinii]|uniref:Protein nlrc3 n=1 Tax=Chrysochromulina tobinii TaxID=1460289 RepID=A0A0M0K7J2_9EUKA|nr:protein nlrc3 [Chrysochromulina tobinii]|eukprot:KOO34547.1 protein nlrc3 [Chrysochromulina sp. CCMP291]